MVKTGLELDSLLENYTGEGGSRNWVRKKLLPFPERGADALFRQRQKCLISTCRQSTYLNTPQFSDEKHFLASLKLSGNPLVLIVHKGSWRLMVYGCLIRDFRLTPVPGGGGRWKLTYVFITMLMLQNLKVRYTADSKTDWCDSEWQLKNKGELNEILTL